MSLSQWQKELKSALEYCAAVIAGPATEPYPQLDPDAWRNMRCRDGRRCHCEFCTWEKRYKGTIAEWQRVNSLRPQIRAALPTLDHVLVSWAERTFYRSAAGALIERARDEASAPQPSRIPWAVRRADVALEVDRAVLWAYSEPKHRHGLSPEECIRILVASVRGTPIPGVDPDLAEKVVRSGRRWVLIDLAARQIIREPRGKRDLIAMHDRIEQLTRKVDAS